MRSAWPRLVGIRYVSLPCKCQGRKEDMSMGMHICLALSHMCILPGLQCCKLVPARQRCTVLHPQRRSTEPTLNKHYIVLTLHIGSRMKSRHVLGDLHAHFGVHVSPTLHSTCKRYEHVDVKQKRSVNRCTACPIHAC